MYKNETTPDEEMQKKLKPIADQIELDFTADAKNFYNRVFEFSDKLTNVSDIIKAYPKGAERKNGEFHAIVQLFVIDFLSMLACLKALKDLGSEVKPGVYLPSNPEAVVISLAPDSGAPMQRYIVPIRFFRIHPRFSLSAAKAPYRATFRVQNVGIEQVENCADAEYELISDASKQYDQMAIFKVGDDVRQVRSAFTSCTHNASGCRTCWHCS